MPTGCHLLLSALCRACPEHQLTLADFSWLPPQPEGALLAPVVQAQRGGNTIDLRGEYLRHPGEADILFPTNFDQLARLVVAASAEARGERLVPATGVSHASTANFMRRWHDVELTMTRSGFNPIVDDFSNTRVLVSGTAGAEGS